MGKVNCQSIFTICVGAVDLRGVYQDLLTVLLMLWFYELKTWFYMES